MTSQFVVFGEIGVLVVFILYPFSNLMMKNFDGKNCIWIDFEQLCQAFSGFGQHSFYNMLFGRIYEFSKI